MRAFAIAILLTTAAGCVDPIDEPSFSITTEGIPTAATVDESFTFNLTAEGELPPESDHIGGHFWANSTADPTADFAAQAGACQHVTGMQSLPGTFEVTCTFSEAGTFYLRAHVRTGSGDEVQNFWGEEHTIVVSEATEATE